MWTSKCSSYLHISKLPSKEKWTLIEPPPIKFSFGPSSTRKTAEILVAYPLSFLSAQSLEKIQIGHLWKHLTTYHDSGRKTHMACHSRFRSPWAVLSGEAAFWRAVLRSGRSQSPDGGGGCDFKSRCYKLSNLEFKMGQLHLPKNVGNLSHFTHIWWGHSAMLSQPTGWKGP